MAALDPWLEQTPRGYCYHSAVRSYKTETLLRKWREGGGTSQQRKTLAYELSFRDPALALAEVKAAIADPKRARQKQTMRLCLHHVADAATARELLATEDFDPDALHLAAFAALGEDFMTALPQLEAASAEKQLRKLGFLAGPVPNPIVDGPTDSEAYATSSDRYDALVLRVLVAAFESASLWHVRAELAEHLRRTYAREAYEFLLARWSRGELPAIAVFAAVPRLGWAETESALGGRLAALVQAFVRDLAGPPCPFELAALENGWLPGSAREFPRAEARDVALAFLDQPRLHALHASAAEVLLGSPADGAADVLDRAASLPTELVARAAACLPYPEARTRLVAVGIGSDHAALVEHPNAPPDLTLVTRGATLFSSDPGGGCELLVRAARDPRHPQRNVAFEQLMEAARCSEDPRSRRFALHALGRVGDPRAESVLRDALSDPTLADARLLLLSALADVAVSASA